MKILSLILIIFFLVSLGIALGDEHEEDYGEESGIELPLDDLFESDETPPQGISYIEMDIRTSTLMELAAWARELGIPDAGTREDIAQRLRYFYGIDPGTSPDSENQTIITIESARTIDYFTITEVDEEYARLSGGVIVSLRDGSTLHRIAAWEILYNRTRNVMTATGGVEYTREEGDTIETFQGESITVNLDNWSSLFLDGASQRSIAGNITAYRFTGTVISRNAEGVTLLTGAEITNPVNEDALWSLNASRLWLLPGNDWAVLNAVLRVGNIPVLYIPFFYFPSDEIVFHPVLGVRSREGTFLQTTTYLMGRPSTGTIAENSITRIFGSADENSERRLEGIFLRSTGERRTAETETRLSLLFDAYVNMGLYLGMEFFRPSSGSSNTYSFRDFTLSAGLGLTRDIFDRDNTGRILGGFTPFPELDGKSSWNSSMFFSMEIPLRYRLNMTGGFSRGAGSLTFSLPFYSDPYVDRDFLRRSEVLDWLAMLREGAVADSHDVSGDSGILSYDWRLSGSYNFSFPSLRPYITSLSISNFSSSLLFNRRDINNYQIGASIANPGQSFFFPHRFTILSLNASIAGTPFRTGSASSASQGNGSAQTVEALPAISPWAVPEDESAENQGADETGINESILTPPVLAQRFSLPVMGGPVLSVEYRINPTSSSELQFDSTAGSWSRQDDINWTEVSTVLTRFRTDGSISFNLGQSQGNVYSAALRLSGTGSWQDFNYLNRDSSEFAGTGGVPDDTRIQAARNRAYRETFFTTNYNLTGTLRPFTNNPVWGASNLQYTLTGLLGRTNVDVSSSNPSWDWSFGEFNRTDISTHQLTANFTASIRDYNQNLNITAVIPPRESMVSASATFRAGISTTNISSRIRNPMDSDDRIIDPVSFTETLAFTPNINFRQHIIFNPEIEEFTTLTSELRLWNFNTAFSASYARPYTYVGLSGGGDIWQLQSDSSLEPREFRLSYSQTFTRADLWSSRLSLSASVNSSLTFDLQRYTRSRMNFSLGLRMGIRDFLELSFTVNSENNIIFQYFQDLPFFSLPDRLYPGQETNIFLDLLNSFRFDREDLRRSSGFKLRSMSFALTHFMGDWNASLSITTSPFLFTGSSAIPTYMFSSEISFLIQWIPIGEIRTQIDYSRDRFIIN